MRKIDWLIAVLLIGMGMMCMGVSAFSFRSMPMMHFGQDMMKIFACAGALAVVLVLVLAWRMLRNKR